MTPFFQVLEQADMAATLAINSLNSPVSDSVWAFISHKETWYPMYIGILVFLIVKLGWKKALLAALACILCCVCCDQLANLSKNCFARFRPCWNHDMLVSGLNVLEGQGNMFGFFSAHSANSMGFALCSHQGFKNGGGRCRRYGIIMAAWAVLVGISRIFVGKHFLGDVLTGLCVGALVGWSIGKLFSLIIRKI